MSNLDLIYGAKKIEITAHCNTTIGKKGTFSARLQPNNTVDDPKYPCRASVSAASNNARPETGS